MTHKQIAEDNKRANQEFNDKYSHSKIKEGLVVVKNENLETTENNKLGSKETIALVKEII